MIFPRFFIFTIILFLLATTSNVIAQSSSQKSLNTLQIGTGYDANVFKTYTSREQDGLIRLLYKTERSWIKNGPTFGLHLGGKKYFTQPAQDTLIGQLDQTWKTDARRHWQIGFRNTFKGQYESKASEPSNSDIEEDFISDVVNLYLRNHFGSRYSQTFYANFYYFSFFGNLAIDFYEEEFGIRISQNLFGPISFQASYEFSLVQFPNSPTPGRDDYQHEIGGAVNYVGPFLLSLGYAFQDSNSSQAIFSSTGHKLKMHFSLALSSWDSDGGEAVTFHFLGNLQVRKFPAVFISDDEGQRLLFSDAEDNNFNSITIKITKKIAKQLTGELLYSRFSNEFSDREESFSRDLVTLGIRASF